MSATLYHQTERYELRSVWPDCFELERLSDHAKAFFQGNDASLWRSNLEVFWRYIHYGHEHGANNYFDRLCETYDEILVVE